MSALKIVNPLLFISLLIQAITIIITKTSFVTDSILKLHEFNGYVFFGLFLIHIYLNFAWIKTNILNKKK